MIMHYQCCKSMSASGGGLYEYGEGGRTALWLIIVADRQFSCCMMVSSSQSTSSYPRTPLLCLINTDPSLTEMSQQNSLFHNHDPDMPDYLLNGNHFHYYQPFNRIFLGEAIQGYKEGINISIRELCLSKSFILTFL